MKNRILGILLIGLLVLPFAGTWIYLSHLKTQLRKEVKHMIISAMNDEDLTLLVFTKKDVSGLKWKHSAEFEYKGQMYDVVRSEEKNGLIYYWCWHDHEETALNDKIEKVLNRLSGAGSQDKQKSQNIHRFYQSLYFSVLLKLELSENNSGLEIIYKNIESAIKGLYPEPPTPPPRLFNNS